MVKCKLDGKVWFIYENMNEFAASIHKDKLVYYREAQVGDYVLSDNGYYIPVIRRYEYVKTQIPKGMKRKFIGALIARLGENEENVGSKDVANYLCGDSEKNTCAKVRRFLSDNHFHLKGQ